MPLHFRRKGYTRERLVNWHLREGFISVWIHLCNPLGIRCSEGILIEVRPHSWLHKTPSATLPVSVLSPRTNPQVAADEELVGILRQPPVPGIWSLTVWKMTRRQMPRLKRGIGICVLASAFVGPLAAHAVTYYVAKTGNNSNLGTSAQPWRTVAYAVSKMVAGDTTYVQGGIYKERLIRFGKSGTLSAPIKLLNAPGQSPAIECEDGGPIIQTERYPRPTNAYMILLQNFSGNNKPIGWITIEGFEIRNCYYAIKFYNAYDLTIRHNWIHHGFPASAILGVGGTRVLIEGNIINHNAYMEGRRGGYGLYANGSKYTVVNNVFYDNAGYAIQLNGSDSAMYDPAKYAGPEFAGSVKWIIANNTFAYQMRKPAIVVWGGRCSNARIENNIFYENCVTCSGDDVQGIDFAWSTSTGITIRNNLAFASGPGGMKFLGSGATEWVHYTQSGNIVNTLNPNFVNAPAALPSPPNFALTSRSPSIDKGLLLAETRIAVDGTPRPQGHAYDIGAYEYKPGVGTEPPAVR